MGEEEEGERGEEEDAGEGDEEEAEAGDEEEEGRGEGGGVSSKEIEARDMGGKSM